MTDALSYVGEDIEVTQRPVPGIQEEVERPSASQPALPIEPASAVQPATTKSSQQRFEMKYWVPERLTSTIVNFGKAYLRVDPHHDENGLQRNTSLYLETSGLDFYQAHIDSAPDRAKLRIRVYGEKPEGLAFFEFKRKVRQVIVKRRSSVPIESVPSVLAGDYDALPELTKPEYRKNLEAFLYYMTIYRAEPAFLVTCVREAYTSPHEDDVRLTIDRHVAYQRAQGASFKWRDRDWVRLTAPPTAGTELMSLVEMKFRGVAPFWMRDLVQLLKLERIAFSKYVSSVSRELEERPNAQAIEESIWT